MVIIQKSTGGGDLSPRDISISQLFHLRLRKHFSSGDLKTVRA